MFSEKHPENYKAMLSRATVLNNGLQTPDPKRIHELDDGDCRRTLVYVIAPQDATERLLVCEGGLDLQMRHAGGHSPLQR